MGPDARGDRGRGGADRARGGSDEGAGPERLSADPDRIAHGLSPPIRTIGHGTLEPAALVELLRGAGVEVVADVRRYPGSRRLPHFARDAMAAWLPEAGIDYGWIVELGGRRRPDPSSPNTGLRNDQFRAYADHMATEEFRMGLDRLAGVASGRMVAVMCAESVWWRCHRRLIADHLVLVEGVAVEHLFHDGRSNPHQPTEGARPVDGVVRYDAQGRLPLG